MDERLLEDLKRCIERYKCDICSTKAAVYDGKTKFGPWAFMCEGCFKNIGIAVGIGKGYRIDKKEDLNERD